VRERAGQSADCAEDAEAPQQLAIDVGAQQRKTDGGRNEMRNRNRSDSEFEWNLRGEHGSEETADAESCEGRNRSGNDSNDEDD
jgi:hypothetical protein